VTKPFALLHGMGSPANDYGGVVRYWQVSIPWTGHDLIALHLYSLRVLPVYHVGIAKRCVVLGG
jgi:hypothetical protein